MRMATHPGPSIRPLQDAQLHYLDLAGSISDITAAATQGDGAQRIGRHSGLLCYP